MPVLARAVSNGSWHVANGCLILLLAGCGASPAGAPNERPSTAVQTNDSRPHASDDQPGRRIISGLGRSTSFFALADTTSSISKGASPFRFADIREECGIDFVHVSGNDKHKLYPTAFGSGVAMVRLRRRRPTRPLLRHLHPPADGNGPQRPQQALQKHGRRQVPATYAGVGPRFRRVSATESSPATSTTTATPTCSSATTVQTCSISTTATARFATSATPPGSTSRTGRPAVRCSTTTTTATSTSTSRTTATGHYPRDVHRCGNDHIPLFCSPWEVRHGQAHPLSQQRRSDLHRRDRPCGRGPLPTATASGSWRLTSTAMAGSTFTSPTI